MILNRKGKDRIGLGQGGGGGLGWGESVLEGFKQACCRGGRGASIMLLLPLRPKGCFSKGQAMLQPVCMKVLASREAGMALLALLPETDIQ